MQSKKDRLRTILEVIQEQEIETQDELLQALRSAGFDVTQATISRDIRELRLTKAHTKTGRQRYIAAKEADNALGDKYIRVMKDGITSMTPAQNLLIVKTVSGMAMAVAAALDAMGFHEVVGCIAGDDTIFVAAHTSEETLELMNKVEHLL